ncbi:hypothetical protein [Polaribacter sp.]|uniref:hypothetical protein n=1 Tax=Polaribacter sp. TaxID=1920175 RepID=UPI004048C280
MNQDSNNSVSFKRDIKTEKLIFVSEILAPSPVCIYILMNTCCKVFKTTYKVLKTL